MLRWQVVQAPVFFPSYDCHIDGGIIATDPSLASIIYSIDKKLGKKIDQIRLLSFEQDIVTIA